jgi:hypothetical protein
MSHFRLSFTERRRRALTLKAASLDRLESRSTVTPIGATALAFSMVPAVGRLASCMQSGGGNTLTGSVTVGGLTNTAANRVPSGEPVGVGLPTPPPGRPQVSPEATRGAGGVLPDVPQVAKPRPPQPAGGDDAISFLRSLGGGAEQAGPSVGLSPAWQPASRIGGGAALPPRGGSGHGGQPGTVAAVQGRVAAPQPPRAPAAPPTIPGILTGGPQANSAANFPAPVITRNAQAQQLHNGTTLTRNAPAQPLNSGTRPVTNEAPSGGGGSDPTTGTTGGITGSAMIPENASSLPYSDPSNPIDGPLNDPLTQFPYYPLYTLDYIQGTVLFPNGYQLATLGGNMDLRAQVKNTTGVSFAWDTSGLTNYATSIATSGTGNYDLTFTWNKSDSTPDAVAAVTLTATDGNNHQESQTYYFAVPAGTVFSNSGGANWPGSLAPDTVSSNAPAWDSQYVRVDANSGALDATIPLPSSNPNIPGIALTYDSLTADPRPLIVVNHILDGSQAVPSQVSAALTFNNSTGTTYYYNTSQFTPGDIEQIALQANATSLATGRYAYTATVVDYRTSNTTITYSGTATVLNQSSSAFGDGWTLQGLEQIIVPTGGGGVILVLGDGGRSLWFAGNPGVGQNYTTPGRGLLDADQDLQRLHPHAPRRDPAHLQRQRLPDGHHRLERPAYDVCLQRLEPAQHHHRSIQQSHDVHLRQQRAEHDPGPGGAAGDLHLRRQPAPGGAAGRRVAYHLHLRLGRADDPVPGPEWPRGDHRV